MNRTAVKVILGALALVVVAGVVWLVATRGGKRPLGGVLGELAGSKVPTETITVTLYFPGAGGALVPERREIEVLGTPKDRVGKVVAAVLEGPRQDDLGRPFPEGTTLGSVMLGGDGTAYVDLRSDASADPPPAGSLEEMQRVFSLVDSVTDAVPSVARVALLWNGLQRESFGGHLDASRPFLADRSLIAE